MAVLKVIEAFRDKHTNETHQRGAVLTMDDAERVSDLASRGLVEVIEEEKPVKKAASRRKK